MQNCFGCWMATPRRESAGVTVLDDEPLCLGCARERQYSDDEIAEGMVQRAQQRPQEKEEIEEEPAPPAKGEKRRMATTKDTVRGFCGCGKRLRKDSPGAKFGKCAKCFKGTDSGDANPTQEPPLPLPSAERKTYSFSLTELQIDRLFLASSFAAKCFAVQTILEQETV